MDASSSLSWKIERKLSQDWFSELNNHKKFSLSASLNLPMFNWSAPYLVKERKLGPFSMQISSSNFVGRLKLRWWKWGRRRTESEDCRARPSKKVEKNGKQKLQWAQKRFNHNIPKTIQDFKFLFGLKGWRVVLTLRIWLKFTATLCIQKFPLVINWWFYQNIQIWHYLNCSNDFIEFLLFSHFSTTFNFGPI